MADETASPTALIKLFNDALDYFEYARFGSNFGTDFQTSLLKLDNARLQLSCWGQAVGLSGDLGGIRSEYEAKIKDIHIVREALAGIIKLFRFIEGHSRLDNLDLAVLDMRADMDAIGHSLHDKMRKLSIERQNRKNLEQKVNSVSREEEQFKLLISRTMRLVNYLSDLCPAVEQERHRLCGVEVSEIGIEGLSVLLYIAKEQDKDLEAAITAAMQSNGGKSKIREAFSVAKSKKQDKLQSDHISILDMVINSSASHQQPVRGIHSREEYSVMVEPLRQLRNRQRTSTSYAYSTSKKDLSLSYVNLVLRWGTYVGAFRGCVLQVWELYGGGELLSANGFLFITSGFLFIIGFLSVLCTFSWRKEAIPPDHHRLYWRNIANPTRSRGKLLYDDYLEREPGALQDLQKHLDKHAYRTRMNSKADRDRPSSAHNFPPAPRSSFAGRQDLSSGDITDQLRWGDAGNGLSSHVQQDVELGGISPSTKHLLSCIEKGRYASKLQQELVTHVNDDRELFYELRRSYHEHRGKHRSYWSLRTIHSIHFMKFDYGIGKYLDVRYHDDICEKGNPRQCIPPPDRVQPLGTEYMCDRATDRWGPSVGPRLMMDFFTDPDEIAFGTTYILRWLARKVDGEIIP